MSASRLQVQIGQEWTELWKWRVCASNTKPMQFGEPVEWELKCLTRFKCEPEDNEM